MEINEIFTRISI